jgi:hypothetical protein
LVVSNFVEAEAEQRASSRAGCNRVNENSAPADGFLFAGLAVFDDFGCDGGAVRIVVT